MYSERTEEKTNNKNHRNNRRVMGYRLKGNNKHFHFSMPLCTLCTLWKICSIHTIHQRTRWWISYIRIWFAISFVTSHSILHFWKSSCNWAHQSNSKGTTIRLILSNAKIPFEYSDLIQTLNVFIYSYTILICHMRCCQCIEFVFECVDVFVPLLVVFGVCAFWLISC